MNKSLYYIECIANKEIQYDNGWANTEYGKENNLIKIVFHKGDVVYFNPKASSNEMHIGYIYDHNKNPYCYWNTSYLPFTRQKRFAKKWQIKDYAEKNTRWINEIGEFEAIIKEIKLTYTEEEI